MTVESIIAAVIVAVWVIWRLGGLLKGASMPTWLNPKNWFRGSAAPEMTLEQKLKLLRQIANTDESVAEECESIAYALCKAYWKGTK